MFRKMAESPEVRFEYYQRAKAGFEEYMKNCPEYEHCPGQKQKSGGAGNRGKRRARPRLTMRKRQRPRTRQQTTTAPGPGSSCSFRWSDVQQSQAGPSTDISCTQESAACPTDTSLVNWYYEMYESEDHDELDYYLRVSSEALALDNPGDESSTACYTTQEEFGKIYAEASRLASSYDQVSVEDLVAYRNDDVLAHSPSELAKWIQRKARESK